MQDFGGSPEHIEAQREFAAAEQIRPPATLTELVQATDDAFLRAEADLALEVAPEDEDKPNTASLEAWILATDQLDDTFLTTDSGALGGKLLELLALSDEDFKKPENSTFASEVLFNTAPIAKELTVLIDRLVQLNPGSTRETIVKRLSSGKLPGSIRVQNVSLTPERFSILGVLVELSKRVETAKGSVSPETTIWKLEREIELPASITIADPFSSTDKRVQAWWEGRLIAAKNAAPDREHSILTVSGDVTRRAEFELANLAERVAAAGGRTHGSALTADAFATACGFLATWLADKSIYYQDPDPRDFELYHLGMENPAELMEFMRSLDLVKQNDPQLFVELCGLNPVDGGPSPYYGSFLHKALGNTQKLVDAAGDSLGDLALKTMMKQLFAMDERVRTYQGVVSQENLKLMAGKVEKAVASEKTDEGKATMLAMLGIPMIPLAIDAEVRRQLESLRGFNREVVRDELKRHLEDIEHPLKAWDYITHLPATAFRDPAIHKQLKRAFGDIWHVGDPTGATYWDADYFLARLYERIPLIDISTSDFGFGKRQKTFDRDRQNQEQLWDIVLGTGVGKAGTMKMERIANRVKGIPDPKNPFSFPESYSDTDRAYLIGFQLVEKWKKQPGGFASDVQWGNATYRSIDHSTRLQINQFGPDKVFLAILAHPEGLEVAWGNFDVFCELVETEKMMDIIHDQIGGTRHRALSKFRERFNTQLPAHNAELVTPYLQQLKDATHNYDLHFVSPRKDYEKRSTLKKFDNPALLLKYLLKIWSVVETGKTPWTIQPSELAAPLAILTSEGGGAIDLFEIRTAIEKEHRLRAVSHRTFPKELPELSKEQQKLLSLELGKQYQTPRPPIGHLNNLIAGIMGIDANDTDLRYRLLSVIESRIHFPTLRRD